MTSFAPAARRMSSITDWAAPGESPVVVALGAGAAGHGRPNRFFSSASVTRFSGSGRNSHSAPRQHKCT